MKNPAPVLVTPSALEFITQRKKGAASVGDLIELSDGRVARIEAIDARTRSIRARPIPGATAGGVDKARKAFRAFSGMEPTEVITAEAGGVPTVCWLLGEVEEILYNTTRDGKKERYLHPFSKSARPLAAVDAAGKLVLVGGDYQVTDRGITDR
mgnify:CR=1 FL=1